MAVYRWSTPLIHFRSEVWHLYKQPNVPVPRSENLKDFIHQLVMFLRDFAADVWKHDSEQEQLIKELTKRIEVLEGSDE